ncbi:9447_t:CDS:2, partial [Funneliformis geosporum]
MHLQDFCLEVLVNGQPLTEYNLPIDGSNLNSTCVSYVKDPLSQQDQYNNFITYIPVTTQGERYTIRTEAKQANMSNIIISRLYIDGNYYQIQHIHQKESSRTISFFVNYERTKVYYFKFASTSQFDKKDGVFKVPYPVNKHPNQLNQNQSVYGKPGTITVCFFKGIIVDESDLLNKPEFEVNQVKITASDNKNMDISYITGFDAMDANIPTATVTKIVDMNPIAVLHLNYRSADWLAKIGFPLPTLSTNQGKKEEVINRNVVMEQMKEIREVQEKIMEIDNTNEAPKKVSKIEKINVEKKIYQAPKVSKVTKKTNVEKAPKVSKETEKTYVGKRIKKAPRVSKETERNYIGKRIKKVPKVSKGILEFGPTNVGSRTYATPLSFIQIMQNFKKSYDAVKRSQEITQETSTINETNILQKDNNLKRSHDEM